MHDYATMGADTAHSVETVGIDVIRTLEARAKAIIDGMRESVFAPDKVKELQIRFNVSTAADMVGRTTKAIRDAENDGRLPESPKDDRGRRAGYTLAQVNRMRSVFGTRPWRDDTDEAVVLAIQNFKGGVGKSTMVSHMAQYLAMKGYRICVVDCDSQASTTSMFGLNPDVDVDEEETLLPFLRHGGPRTLHYALRPTYWDGLSLVPANLRLYDAEYEFAARLVQEDRADQTRTLDRLRLGIDTIADQFDVVLLDPPPALGMISIGVLRAANALLIPVPPATIDFGSTGHFFSMLVDLCQILSRRGLDRQYKFLKLVATKVNEGKSAHIAIKRMMDSAFAGEMLQAALKESAEIDNATAQLQTVYELTGPVTNRETHRRCRTYLDAVNEEVELLIRKTWPSHRAQLQREGRL